MVLLRSSGHKESICYGRSGWNVIFFPKQILLFWKDFLVAVHNFILKARIMKLYILVRLPHSAVIESSIYENIMKSCETNDISGVLVLQPSKSCRKKCMFMLLQGTQGKL